MGVQCVTIESVRGRGEVEVKPEGESEEGGTDRGGRGCQGKGNEGVSKIVPATQIHSLRVQLTVKEDRHGWRQTGGENREQVRGNKKPSAANLVHLILSIYIRKPLDNL